MPHHPKPFFRRSRQLWYVQIHGKQHNLGPDEKAAFRRYYELMRKLASQKTKTVELAVVVLDEFLDFVQKNNAPRGFEWYQRHCQLFANSLPSDLQVKDLKPFHVTRVLNQNPDWSPATKEGMRRAIKRAFRWAKQEGHIKKNPLKKLKRAEDQIREVIISPEEFETILRHVHSGTFRDILVTAWETGARPQEIIRVEARHVELDQQRWHFPIAESKGKRRPRIVYLNQLSLEITRRLVARHPTGPLFRNEDGEPWNRFSLNCAFARLQISMGLARMKELNITVEPVPRFNAAAFASGRELIQARADHEKKLKDRRKALNRLARQHAKKYTTYHFRHSWATRSLRNGVDPLTVAILMGHSNPAMVAKVYQHLAQDPEYLRNAAKKAVS